MIRLTLAQMRVSLGRLIPAGLAILLGTAFVTVTLIAGNTMTRSTNDQVTAQYAAADLVVTGKDGASVSPAQLADIRATDGVTAAEPLMMTWLWLDHGSRSTSLLTLPVAAESDLSSLRISSGKAPTGTDQIALPAQVAERLRVGVGDQVNLNAQSSEGEAQTKSVTVVGLVDDPHSAWTMWGRAGLADYDALVGWSGVTEPTYDAVLVATPDPEATAAALSSQLGDAQVRTRSAVAEEKVSSLTDGSNVLVSVVLAFAAIALLVAALVIANTFQVLIAQRTRTLALLRCVGAKRSQLRRAVLVEGGVLGLVASLSGLIVGVVVAQAALSVLGRMDLGIPLPGVVPMSVWVVVAPLLVGTAVTVAASLVPARAASRVTPVEALRPADGPTVRSTAGRIRLALAVVLTLGGAVLLAGGTFAALRSHDYQHGALWLLAGILGAAVSFLGVMVGAVFWMPQVVGGIGAVLGRIGPASRLAAANAQRNPRRTAATSAALLIGVTLVVTMSTGAATARHSLDAILDERFPVDLVADTFSGDSAGLSSAELAAVGAVDGIDEAVAVRTTSAKNAEGRPLEVYALSTQQARAVLQDQALIDALEQGKAVVASSEAGTRLALTGAHGDVSLATTDGWGQYDSVLIPLASLVKLDADAPTGAVWARLTDDARPSDVVSDVQDALGDTGVSVSSAAAERAQYQHLIDIMLAIVVALLAVAVVIALIGVANTLSLSVLERRRESATLRSIGMTRRQLRGSLAVEGILVAVVGTVTGVALGLAYGWAGSAIIFAGAPELVLSVPWADLAAVLLVAVLAGLLASVLPARSAVRTSPVAALAVE